MAEPTTTSPDLSPAEIAALFNDQFSDMKSAVRVRQPFLPRISLCVPKTMYKDKKGVKIGDWYLTPGDTPQGEEPKYENLGAAFECTVLHASMQLSLRDDDGKTLIESSEFQNFSGDPVFLLDGRSGPLHLAAVAPYSGNAVHTISALRKDTTRFPTKKNKAGTEDVSSLGFDFNVYVLLNDGRLAVLQNTKRGHFGTDPKTGLTSDFDNVSLDSFIRVRTICNEQTPGLTLAHRLRASSAHVGGGSDEPRPAFQVLGLQDPAKVSEIRKKAEALQQYLLQKWTDKIGYAWSNTSPAQREKMVTAYSEIRMLLDTVGGHEVAARITLGKKSAPALLSEPEPDYREKQLQLEAENGRKIDELADEMENERALPREVIDIPASLLTDYNNSQIKVEDLPF